MFILQTSIAVLVAFLALIAYEKITNLLARGTARKKDLESPPSPIVAPALDGKNDVPQLQRGGVYRGKDSAIRNQMDTHKQLYYKLHNLEQFPEVLPRCWD